MINNENCCLCFELLDIECTIWKCSECNWVSHDYCIYLWLYYSNINNICICPHCQRVLDINNMPEYSNSIINIYNLKCCGKYIFYKTIKKKINKTLYLIIIILITIIIIIKDYIVADR